MENEQLLTEEQMISEDAQQILDEQQPESPEQTPEDEISALRAEVARLTRELEQKQTEMQRVGEQIGEFAALFPSVSPSEIPESVWDSVKEGNTLAAAYALYHRREQIKAQRVNEINQKNAQLSTGSAGRGASGEYFTPDEVRAMSQRQVRANYSKIIESMKKWN